MNMSSKNSTIKVILCLALISMLFSFAFAFVKVPTISGMSDPEYIDVYLLDIQYSIFYILSLCIPLLLVVFMYIGDKIKKEKILLILGFSILFSSIILNHLGLSYKEVNYELGYFLFVYSIIIQSVAFLMIAISGNKKEEKRINSKNEKESD